MPSSTAVGSAIPSADVKGNRQQPMVPFRIATLERTEILPAEAGTITAAQQPIDRVIEGSGFLYDVTLRLQVTTAANAAAVTFAEDGPWSSLGSVILRDPTGEIVNLSGFHLYLANLAMRNYATNFIDLDTSGEFYSAVTGGGATGGSFLYSLHVPAGINRRTLLGVLGNQDRAVKYQLRTDIAPSGSIYGTAPTNAGTFAMQKHYSNYSVPAPVGLAGPQQVIPDGFGTLQFHTSTISEAVPAPSTTVNHYLRRVGNTVRYIALVFRAGGATPRVTAQTNVDRIQLKIGDADLFNEQYTHRRLLNYERYGFRLPVGVAVYDWMHDFTAAAGMEIGDDWLNTREVNTAQFLITYLAGMTAGGSLTFLTSDLALVGQPIGS